MNFWTFLDRNSHGLGLLVFAICLCFAYGTLGDGNGCRMRCGDVLEIRVDPTDAGVP